MQTINCYFMTKGKDSVEMSSSQKYYQVSIATCMGATE